MDSRPRFSTAFVVLSLTAAGVVALISPGNACTGIRLMPKDGSVIYGRTLEFEEDLRSDLIIIPRGKSYVGVAPAGKPGLPWTMKYAAVGANGYGLPMIVDGTNEKGLAIGIFLFPGYAKYQQPPADSATALAPWELPTFLLGTCTTAEEAVKAAKKVAVCEVTVPEVPQTPPVHFVVHDSQGRCAVLEYVKGELRVYDNPLGVITNSPTFDWHLTNLRNYVNLTPTNAPPVEVMGVTLTPLGQGSGLLGLPGDFTPPSRFVRAVAFTQSAAPVATAKEGVSQAFHVLNQFDIPKGSVRQKSSDGPVLESTEWTSASDVTNHRYYIRTYARQQILMVDLMASDLDAKTVKTILLSGEDDFVDVTSKAK